MAIENQLHLEDESPNFDLNLIVLVVQVLQEIVNNPFFFVQNLDILRATILYDDNFFSLLKQDAASLICAFLISFFSSPSSFLTIADRKERPCPQSCPNSIAKSSRPYVCMYTPSATFGLRHIIIIVCASSVYICMIENARVRNDENGKEEIVHIYL